jgi:hypothetical protein
MRIFIMPLIIFATFAFVDAQSCRPAELNYFVRDSNGRLLTESQLKSIARRMSTPVPSVTIVGLAANGKLVGYSGKPAKSTQAALSYTDAKTCHLKIDEWSLSYRGRTMRLIFDLDLERRAYTFDSLPFRSGTYRLDQEELAATDNNEVISASRWKRVRRRPAPSRP